MHELLTAMPLERLQGLYEALPDELARALDAPIAKALNSRPQTVAKRPVVMRMKALSAWLRRTRDDTLAGELLRTYLLGPRKELVVDFLDATGVEHEDGEIEGDGAPDEARVPDALEALLADHDPGDVALYLEVATRQWPDSEAVTAARDKAKAAAEGAAAS